MTNGSYRNSVNKLKKDLASKYTIDIETKGKDNSTGGKIKMYLNTYVSLLLLIA